MDEVKDYPPYLDYPKPHKAKTNADRIRREQEERRWIPVAERFPDDWVDVLARLQCGDCVVAVKSGPIWRERFTNIRLEDEDVTHWMPLPEPPRENDHE